MSTIITTRPRFSFDRYASRTSTAYLDARDALVSLAGVEGWDRVDRAYASAVKASKEDQLRARLNGARRSTGHACIARLIGGRCRDSVLYPVLDVPSCRAPGSDHAQLWITNGKPVAYTSEPYGLDEMTLIEMVEFAERWNLGFEIDANPSPHFTGRTLLVIWRKRTEKTR